MPSAVRAIYRIPADEDCPAWARAIVDRELAARVPRPTLEELELLVSELVTRAIPGDDAARDDAPAPVVLDLRIDHRVLCAVTVPGGGPSGGRELADGLRGWSLRMVVGLAERWGVSRTAGNASRVWFETDLPA